MISKSTYSTHKALKYVISIILYGRQGIRPTEVETLLGDPTKAKEKLGWVPEITLQEMCTEMVNYDLEQAKQHAFLKKHGYDVTISSW